MLNFSLMVIWGCVVWKVRMVSSTHGMRLEDQTDRTTNLKVKPDNLVQLSQTRFDLKDPSFACYVGLISCVCILSAQGLLVHR